MHRLRGGAAIEARAVVAAVDDAVASARVRLRAIAARLGARALRRPGGPSAVDRVHAGVGAVTVNAIGNAIRVVELAASTVVVCAEARQERRLKH